MTTKKVVILNGGEAGVRDLHVSVPRHFGRLACIR